MHQLNQHTTPPTSHQFSNAAAIPIQPFHPASPSVATIPTPRPPAINNVSTPASTHNHLSNTTNNNNKVPTCHILQHQQLQQSSPSTTTSHHHQQHAQQHPCIIATSINQLTRNTSQQQHHTDHTSASSTTNHNKDLTSTPGVDVLENRWAAASTIFEESDLEVVGAEFTGGDGAKIKDLVTQYLQRDDVDGIWMDAGDGAVAAVEAFEDAGKDYPVMVGEDELSFMRKWQETEMTAIAPVYSNFQWRTPILAAQQIWAGEEVPKEWVLPQEPITEDDRDEFLDRNKDMPSLHYAKFGGEDLPGFPEVWQDR